ncbi:hypothetical protein J5X84_31995 [Streptosporangiaceae bacterium NEAU-GS5]|nr:hypothetical protein [Streptosporangiaceae bacterium NEAU-GS5]
MLHHGSRVGKAAGVAIAGLIGRVVTNVHWSTGGLLWYQTDWMGDDYTEKDLLTAASGIHPELHVQQSGHGGLFPDWPFNVPAGIGWVAGAAWVVTLLLMLNTPEPRYANRWAWFWMFTVGQAGAILFLLLEPRSLWYGTQPQAPRPTRMSGGNGCLTSILLGIVTSVSLALFAKGIEWFY